MSITMLDIQVYTEQSLAKTFKISPVVVFRKAVLLPESQSEQVKLEDWKYLLSQFPNDDQVYTWFCRHHYHLGG